MELAYIAFKNFRGDVGYDFDLGGIGYKSENWRRSMRYALRVFSSKHFVCGRNLNIR